MPPRDLTKESKELYSPPANKVVFVDVPPMTFLMVDGMGNPNSAPEYKHAVEALYSLSYKLKFMLKKEAGGLDYKVAPLEGLWWAENMAEFSLDDKDAWLWTMMIRQPEEVTAEYVERARGEVAKKKSLSALARVRLDSLHEGSSAQLMHLGPYADEAPSIEKLHSAIRENGHKLRGKHHEIYLSDPNRSVPEKMRTVLRQPVERA